MLWEPFLGYGMPFLFRGPQHGMIATTGKNSLKSAIKKSITDATRQSYKLLLLVALGTDVKYINYSSNFTENTLVTDDVVVMETVKLS